MPDVNPSRRYAKALLAIAVEDNSIDSLAGELDRVIEAITAEGNMLLGALENPVVTAEERANVLNAVLPRLQLGPIATNFLMLVSDRGRFGLVPEIIDVFRGMVDERSGRIRVAVTTVEPLTPQLEGEIRAAFEKATGKAVILDSSIDPSLIGGLVARIGSKVYDASIRSRLEDIKHRLTDAQVAAEA